MPIYVVQDLLPGFAPTATRWEGPLRYYTVGGRKLFLLERRESLTHFFLEGSGVEFPNARLLGEIAKESDLESFIRDLDAKDGE